ncbi:hypothetical protein I546_7210 [Mycobacterium kansasii 732]|nr:hypothetical protein I546_7210 [Mycobacterium kansasii 732]
MALTSCYALRTVYSTHGSAGADIRGGFCCRRVAVIAVSGVGSLLTERMGQRFTELVVFGLQMLDALGSGLQPLEQGGVGGALPIRDRSVRCRSASPGSEALDFSA